MNLKSMQIIGRETELNILKQSILTDSSQTSLTLINGISGIGKTSLALEFAKIVRSNNGVFISGKYEEVHNNVPYSGLIQALNEYFKYLAEQHCSISKNITENLEKKLKENILIITNLIPNARHVFSTHSQLASLSPQDAQHRFEYVLSTLFEVLNQYSNNLVIYLDDLQWADDASLHLITAVLAKHKNDKLHFLGSYRGDEVGISHKLSKTVHQLKKSNISVVSIALKSLSRTDCKLIVNKYQFSFKDNFELDTFVTRLFEVTSGNPLFVTQLLENYRLEHRSLSEFLNSEKNRDTNLLGVEQSKRISNLLVVRFRKLSYECQKLLKIASCLGTTFDHNLLLLLCNIDKNIFHGLLKEAEESGVIKSVTNSPHSTLFQFSHDRIRQAAYSLIEDTKQMHFEIGRVLMNNYRSNSNFKSIDEMLIQLNLAKELLKDADERLELADLNAKYAYKFRSIGALKETFAYLRNAKNLLPANAWTTHHDLTFNIYFSFYECCYLLGEFDQADRLFELIIERSINSWEKIRTVSIKIQHHTNLGKWNEAVNLILSTLGNYEIDLTSKGEFDDILMQLHDYTNNDIVNLPVLNDTFSIAILELLNSAVSPLYVVRPELLIGLTATVIEISLKKGISKETCYGLEMLGTLLCAIKQDYKQGNAYAQLSLKINNKLKDKTFLCKLKLTYTSTISHWSNPLSYGLNLLKEAISDGLNAGDILNTGYCIVAYNIESFASGKTLNILMEEIRRDSAFLNDTKNPAKILMQITRQMIENLTGNTASNLSISNDSFNEELILNEMKNIGFIHGVHYYFLNKMLLSIIYSEFENIDTHINHSATALTGATGQFSVADHNFYHSLILAIQHDNEDQHYNKVKIIKQIKNNQLQMKTWAEHSPVNFKHKYLLIDAELKRLNNDKDAQHVYERCLKLAIENNFIQDAAIACERAALLKKQNGDHTEERIYISKSQELYNAWGATRKSNLLHTQLEKM